MFVGNPSHGNKLVVSSQELTILSLVKGCRLKIDIDFRVSECIPDSWNENKSRHVYLKKSITYLKMRNLWCAYFSHN